MTRGLKSIIIGVLALMAQRGGTTLLRHLQHDPHQYWTERYHNEVAAMELDGLAELRKVNADIYMRLNCTETSTEYECAKAYLDASNSILINP